MVRLEKSWRGRGDAFGSHQDGLGEPEFIYRARGKEMQPGRQIQIYCQILKICYTC